MTRVPSTLSCFTKSESFDSDRTKTNDFSTIKADVFESLRKHEEVCSLDIWRIAIKNWIIPKTGRLTSVDGAMNREKYPCVDELWLFRTRSKTVWIFSFLADLV